MRWLEMLDAQSKNRSIDLVKHESERIERAERRHLRAVKMLATIRKMALPLRIDIKAEVNVSKQKTSVGSSSRFDFWDLVN
jgi:Holliday junction resolvase RusA-like endonuclease